MGNRQASRLTDEQVEELQVQSRHFSCDEILAIYRQFCKDFPTGFITREAFMNSYSRYFRSQAEATFCNQLYNAYDTDKNNRVDFREFLVGLDITMYGSTEQKLDWAFRMLNLDGDAYLTENEISTVLEAIYTLKKVENASDRARSNAQIIMKNLDTDKNGMLSKDEFSEAPTKYPYLVKIIETL